MKKKNLLVLFSLCFSLICNSIFAQIEIDTTFSYQMNTIFGNLDKTKVPFGILRDYGMEFTNIENYNGTTALADSNYADASSFWDVYQTLLTSRFSTSASGFVKGDTVDNRWYNQRVQGKIVLSGLYFNYARFKDDAANNYVTITNGKLYDKYINGVYQNPYQNEQAFLLSPPVDFYQGKNLQVLLPANLWFTNNAAGITSLQMDAGDGTGYRTLTQGVPITLNYTDTGRKEWTYKLTLTGGTVLYSHSQITIQTDYTGSNPLARTNGTYGTNGITGEAIPPAPFTATKTYLGVAGQGYATILYANADHILRKPLIVVEGFDAGKILAPEEKFGLNTLQDFIKDAINDGSNLTNLLSGPMQQYDIIYVDWKNGTDYLQRNAYLLETVIQWVNANKQPLNGVMQPNVVLGQSMGGVIARYALKDMENTAVDHNTRLYISDDAPHQGANVPQGYQHLARHARSLYIRAGFTAVVVEIIQLIRGKASPLAVLSLADQPASKEMLINFVDGSNNVDNTVHSTWQTELKNLGYPAGFSGTPFRFVAISNGSECANPQPFGPGANLLTYTGKANTRILGDLAGIAALPLAGFLLGQPPLLLGVIPGRNDFAFDFAVNAQADGTSNQVYKGKITYTKKILWLLPVSVNITNKAYNSSASTLPYDYFPGGYYYLGTINSSSNQTVFYKYNITVTNQPGFNFVPTVSALDIGSNNVTLTKADYLTSYIGANPPLTPKNTPFQNFITAFNVSKINEQHISIEARNGDWIAAELNSMPLSENCSYLCGNQIINGPAQFCDFAGYSFNLPAGSSISWSAIPANIVSFVSPNAASTTVNQIGSGNVTLMATITTPCGTLTIPKTVQVGPIPLSSYSIAGATTVYASAGYNYALTFPVRTLPSNIFWRVPSGWSILSGQGTTNIHIWTGSQGGQVQCDFDNTCGSPTGIFITAVIGVGGPDPEITTPETSKLNTGLQLTATPNPASNKVLVSLIAGQSTAKTSDGQLNIRQIKITDKTGMVKKQFSFNTASSSQSINVQGMLPDIYFIQAFTGKEWLSCKLVIVK